MKTVPHVTSRDGAILNAFEQVRAHRAHCYSYDDLPDTAETTQARNALDAFDNKQSEIEGIVYETPAQTPSGVAAKLVLISTIECTRQHDRDFSEKGLLALYSVRDRLDCRDKTLVSAAYDLMQIEWQQALGAYLCNERDRDLVLRLKGVIEKEQFRLPKGAALGEALTQALAIVQEAEDRFCNESAIESLFRTLAPDFDAYRRKAQIAIDEQYNDEAAPWLLRDVNFLMGAIPSDQSKTTGEPA